MSSAGAVLRHVILGFLIQRPMHGYELKRMLAPALPRHGSINDGSLYPLLRKLEAEGLATKRVERHGNRPERHVYRPTARGRRAFRDWLRSTEDEDDAVTYDFFVANPFLAKCLFVDDLEGEELRQKLEAQRETSARKLEEFKRIRRRMTERAVAPHRIAVIDLGIAQQREKVRWLRRWLEELGAGVRGAEAGGEGSLGAGERRATAAHDKDQIEGGPTDD